MSETTNTHPPIVYGKTDSFYEALSKIGNHFVIMTDSIVKKLYANQLQKTLLRAGFEVVLIHFEPGEKSKSRTTKALIEDQMLEKGVTREWGILALGGGVVSDLAGFIAATYMRGLPLVLIPTTLLAMCDAAHGGKNGINTQHGKNTIGTFYYPELIIIDTHYLKTLPNEEVQNGLSEILKIAILRDEKLLTHLWETGLHPIEPILKRAIEHKYAIIQLKGMRDLLNFGHTVGHALERATDYTISHGEAIAIGMAIEAPNTRAIFEHFSYPLECKIPTQHLMKAILQDKKRKKSVIQLARIPKIGHSHLEWVELDEIEGMIDAMHHKTVAH